MKRTVSEPAVKAANTAKNPNQFFYRIALASLVVVLAGFAGRAVMRPDLTPGITPMIAVHALIMVVWYSLVCWQTRLVTGRNIALHKRIGSYSPVLVAAILISGTLVTLNTYTRRIAEGINTPELAVYLSFSSLLGFVILYGLAYRMRGQWDFHKRYMLLAGVAMMLAATFRLAAAFGAPQPIPLGIVIQYVFITAIMFYDLKQYDRLHTATMVSMLVCLAMTVGIFTVGSSDPWIYFIKGALSP